MPSVLALPTSSGVWLALGVITVLTLTNLTGLRVGASLQNGLTVAKLFGLVCVVLAASCWRLEPGRCRQRLPAGNIGLAMVMIFYAYAGWTHAAYVASELRGPWKNLPRTLLVGVVTVTLLYLVVNHAYVLALGFDAARASNTPAADAMRSTLGGGAARLVSLLAMLSALGAINGTILTGAFVLAELGRDYAGLGWLQRAALTSRPPAPRTAGASGCSGTVGRHRWHGCGPVDARPDAPQRGLATIPWADYEGGFNTLVAASAPLFWGFLLLTGTSQFVLRCATPIANAHS